MHLISGLFHRLIPIGLIASIGYVSISAALPSKTTRIDGFGVDLVGSMPATSEQVAATLDSIQSSGAHYVRIDFNWSEIETSPDVYNWSGLKPLDLLIPSAADRALNLVAVLTGGPTYLTSPGNVVDQAQLGVRWEKFVQAAVDRFGEQINIWEIGNQVNTTTGLATTMMPSTTNPVIQPDPAFYAKLLRSASKIIKKADANDQVWIGALVSPTAPNCAVNPLTFLLEVHGAQGWNSADAISYQPQRGGTAPEFPPGLSISPACGSTITTSSSNLIDEIRSVQELARQLGGKPVYITRLNWSSEELGTLSGLRLIAVNQLEADMLVRASIGLMASDSLPIIFWKTDLMPQSPVANALRNLSDLLVNAKPIGQVQGETGSLQEFRFQKGADLKIFTWRTQDGDSPAPVNIPNIPSQTMTAFSTDSTSLSNTLGTRLEVDGAGNTILMLNERPVVLTGKTGTWQDQLQNSITDQMDVWKQQTGDVVKQWMNDLKLAFLQMIENLFNQAKDNAVQWGEEKLNEILN
jgi:hypothetical protein